MESPSKRTKAMKEETEMFPSGTYFIGDLIYAFGDNKDWKAVYGTVKNKRKENGHYKTKSGIEFGCFFASSRYTGDEGNFVDQDGNNYIFETRLIGCVPAKLCALPLREAGWPGKILGLMVEFPEPFAITQDKGGRVIKIGHKVLTLVKPEFDEEEEEDDEEEPDTPERPEDEDE
jgi:hypothetical protein